MSKGGRVLESMKENGWTEFPRQWWTASMQCKKMFRDSIIRMDAIFAKALFYQLEHFLHDGTITWARFVDVCVSGEIRTMGLVGEFSAKAYRCISTA